MAGRLQRAFKATILFLLFPLAAFAVNDSPQTFTLDGQFFQSGTTTPLLDTAAKVTIQILSDDAKCVLYEEEQTVDTHLSQGRFTIQVGSDTASAKRTTNDKTHPMALIFQNATPITGNNASGQNCAGGTYTPLAGHNRYFRLTIEPSATHIADTLAPDMMLDSVPNALVAETVQGLDRANILQVNNGGGVALTQPALEAMFTNPAYANLQKVMTGNFMQINANGAPLPVFASNPSAPTAGEVWYDSVANVMKYYNGTVVKTISATGSSVTSITGGTGLTGGTITSTGTLAVDVGMGANKIVQLTAAGKYPAVDGSLITNLTGITALTGEVTASGPGSATATIANNAITSAKIASTGGGTSRILITDATTGASVGYASCTTAGEVLHWTLSGWACATVSSFLGASGVTAGTYGNATQVTRVTVDSQGRVTSLTNVNINFPVTSVNGKTGGAITLNGSDLGLGTASTQDYGTAANQLLPLNASAQIPAVDGSLITNVNATKLMGRAVSAVGPAGGQVLTWNSASSFWEPSSVTSGTVTNVTGGSGLLGGSINGAGTLSVDTGTTANKIVQLDSAAKLPVVDGSQVTNINATRVGTRTVSSALPTAGQVMTWNGTNTQWEPMSTSAAGVTNVTAGSGLTGGVINSVGTLAVDSGTTANKILQLDNNAKIPAVDGYQVTNLNATRIGTRTISNAAPAADQVIAWNNTTSQWEPMNAAATGVTNVTAGAGLLGGAISATGTLSVDTGTTANKIIQLDNNAKIPAVDGSQVTNINATKIGTRTISSVAPASGQVIAWNNTTSLWEPSAISASSNSWVNGGNSFGSSATLGTNDFQNLSLLTNGTARISIANSGNVGIGTISPAHLLDTQSVTSNAFVSRIYYNLADNGDRGLLIKTTSSAGGQSDHAALSVLTGTRDALFVTTTGMVGIGSNVATTPLDVTGIAAVRASAAGPLLYLNPSGNNGYPEFGMGPASGTPNDFLIQNNGYWHLFTNSAKDLSLGANTSVDQLFLKQNGSVGIGTSNPLVKMHVNNGVDKNLFVLGATASYGSTNGMALASVNDANNAFKDLNISAANLVLQAGSGSGNVGIGTTSPAYKLDVMGNLNATAITVNGVPVGMGAGTVSNVTGGSGLLGGSIGTTGTLSVDTGTTANKIVQLDSNAKIPSVDGSLVTNINAVKIGTRTISSATPANGQIVAWNSTTSVWEPSAAPSPSQWLNGASSSIYYTSGNVGIGTTTAGSTVQVTATDANATTPYSWSNFNGAAKTSTVLGMGIISNSAATAASQYAGSIDLLNVNPASISSTTFVGRQGNIFVPAASTNNLSQLILYSGQNTNLGSGTITNMTGNNYAVYNGGTGTVATMYGLNITSGNSNPGPNQISNITNLYGASISLQNLTNQGTVGTGYGVYVTGSSVGTFTNEYGVYVSGITGGAHTNIPYDFYAGDSSAYNYFAGNVGIGTTTPKAILDVYGLGTMQSAIIVPRDTVANRPSTAIGGMIRYASDTNVFEAYANGNWQTLSTNESTNAYTGDLTLSGAGTGLTVTNTATIGGNLTVTGATVMTGGVTSSGALTVSAGGTNKALVLSGSGTGGVLITPNVGIGTTTARVSLDVGARTDAIALPAGTTAQEPGSATPGFLRYNTQVNVMEFYNGSSWQQVVGGGSAVDPAGLVAPFSLGACPSGWLEADGTAVSRTTYASLFSAMGTTYGVGDGSTTFNLPDLRGQFIRGYDHGRGVDVGRTLASTQAASRIIANIVTATGGYSESSFSGMRITADIGPNSINLDNRSADVTVSAGAAGDWFSGGTGNSNWGTSKLVRGDTRPTNVAMMYCVSAAINSATTVASTGTGTTSYVPKWTSSTALGNSILFDAGTGIGIGVTAPKSGLDVNNISVGSYAAVTAAPTGGMIVSGGVGIGTSSPLRTLSVYVASDSVVADVTSGGGALFDVVSNAGTKGAAIRFNGSAVQPWVVGSDPSIPGSPLVIAGGSNTFMGSIATANKLLTITTAGNVGIGTTSPASPMELISTVVGPPAGFTGSQYSTNTTGFGFYGRKARGNVGSPSAVADGDFLTLLLASPHDGSNFLNTGYVGFRSNGTVATGSVPTDFIVATGTTGYAEKMRVTSGGNVGIGTTTPGAKLDVQGTVKIVDGSQGVGKTLTSDANGLASWSGPSYAVVSTTVPASTVFNSGNNFYYTSDVTLTQGIWLLNLNYYLNPSSITSCFDVHLDADTPTSGTFTSLGLTPGFASEPTFAAGRHASLSTTQLINVTSATAAVHARIYHAWCGSATYTVNGATIAMIATKVK